VTHRCDNSGKDLKEAGSWAVLMPLDAKYLQCILSGCFDASGWVHSSFLGLRPPVGCIGCKQRQCGTQQVDDVKCRPIYRASMQGLQTHNCPVPTNITLTANNNLNSLEWLLGRSAPIAARVPPTMQLITNTFLDQGGVHQEMYLNTTSYCKLLQSTVVGLARVMRPPSGQCQQVKPWSCK
jgi:hypothetical protein